MGMRSLRSSAAWSSAAPAVFGVAAIGLAALAGCDQRLAAQPAREHDSFAALESMAATGTDPLGSPERSRPAAAPVKQVDGRPVWSDSRRYSADENARYQFEHHGAELGAAGFDDFVARAHAFVNAPPKGALTLTRANGDRLLYDPKSGLFGVARSDGAPRTVFKPEDGQAYWDQQVAEQSGTSRRTAARSGAAGSDRS